MSTDPTLAGNASAAGSGERKPTIDAIQRDIALANTYRLELIKYLLAIAAALFAFTVTFRPSLSRVDLPWAMWLGWIGLGISMVGGIFHMLGWDHYYKSYRDHDWGHADSNEGKRAGKAARRTISGKSPELQDQARKDEALKLRGIWDRDLGTMTGLKTLQALGLRARRYTTGQISEAVRDDEDYMEVLKIDSFGTDRLQEARISAAEAAHDALTGDRLRSRCAPRMEALIWRERRRRAEEELRRNRVRVRVVTTSGRTKD
jgi:hypothetical protein